MVGAGYNARMMIVDPIVAPSHLAHAVADPAHHHQHYTMASVATQPLMEPYHHNFDLNLVTGEVNQGLEKLNGSELVLSPGGLSTISPHWPEPSSQIPAPLIQSRYNVRVWMRFGVAG